MDEYVTVSCSNCTQPIYLARHRLEARQWNCPACGAANLSNETRQPVFVPSNRAESRFPRAAQTSPAPR
jgi:hypothetical protein